MSITSDLIKTYSGLLGNLVMVHSRKGNSIITRPFVKHKKKPTENQEKMRLNFAFASRYAKNALQNPDLLAAYTAKSRNGLTPYVLAVTDYLKPPYVDQVDASGYQGAPGDKIIVTADDDFEVASVIVQLISPAGVLIEQGECVFNLVTGNFDFTATV